METPTTFVLTSWTIFLLIWNTLAQCPKSDDYLRRIGNTRFYILQKNQRDKDVFVDWKGAFKLCEKHGMKLAKIDKITTYGQMQQPLSDLIDANKFYDTWYWIAAKYDKSQDKYKWHDSPGGAGGNLLNYSNYFYRQPRPTGVGGHVDLKQRYNAGDDVDQCLTFAYPYPGLQMHNGEYGHAATIDERACASKTSRHPMCEAPDPCKLPDPGPYVLSEGKEPYFDEGNWIFGKRRYIVNWAQRNFEDAKAYCTSLGLQLYSPDLTDACLIPFIKMWTRNITNTHLWTSWSYDSKDENFRDADNKIKARSMAQNKDWDESKDTVRSNKKDRRFCVSMIHSYEFPRQMPCPSSNYDNCAWHFVSYVPANCFNPQATICQHKDYEKRQCIWKKEYIKNINQGLIDTATVPFGFPGNKEYLRSTYKQTFGSLICPEGYNMVRERNTKWHQVPSDVTSFKYDFVESYWVVDPDKFNKPPGSKCSVSRSAGGSRTVQKVPCTEWNFYLCKKRKSEATPPKPSPPPGFSPPQWKWNDEPTPRKYGW